MDEESLRVMLADAISGEPPIGPISQRALRAGIRLRRRHRAGTAGSFAVVAGIAVAFPLALHSPGMSPASSAARPPTIHERAGAMGGHGDLPRKLSFTPDSKIVATADNDGTARLWNAATERQMGKPIKVTGAQIWDVTFSPTGAVLVTGDSHGAARFWDVASHRQIGAPIKASSRKLNWVMFSPNGKILATAGDDGTLRLWNAVTRREIGAPMTSPGNRVVGQVIFSPDGKLVAASDSDGTVRLWSVATQRLVGQLTDRQNFNEVQAVAFSPDGKIVAVAGSDLRVWSVATHRQLGRTMHPSEFATNGVVFTLDGKTMISTSANDLFKEWNVATDRAVGSVTVAGNVNNFSSVVISPDGKLLGTTSYSGPARLWRLTR
jgi:WD40 repeat protein